MAFSQIDILEEFASQAMYARRDPTIEFEMRLAQSAANKREKPVSVSRRKYKAEWARAKYRRDAAMRARKNAADLARYYEKKRAA